MKLGELRPDDAGLNLVVKVVEARGLMEKSNRPGGQPQKVAECLLGDETGVILLTARRDQVEHMRKGAYVALRGAKVEMVRGNMRLLVPPAGKVEPAAGASFDAATDVNLSTVEYELVTVPSPPAAAAATAQAAEPAAAADGGGGGGSSEPAADAAPSPEDARSDAAAEEAGKTEQL